MATPPQIRNELHVGSHRLHHDVVVLLSMRFAHEQHGIADPGRGHLQVAVNRALRGGPSCRMTVLCPSAAWFIERSRPALVPVPTRGREIAAPT